MYISHFGRYCLSNYSKMMVSTQQDYQQDIKVAFLPRSLQNWILSIFQNIYQARNQKIVSFHLHCFNYFVPTFFDYFFISFREMSACPYFLFSNRVSFFLLFVELLHLLWTLRLFNLCYKYFLQAFMYECWFWHTDFSQFQDT